MAWAYAVKREQDEQISAVVARRKQVTAAGFKAERYGFPSEEAAQAEAERISRKTGVVIETFEYSPGLV